VNSAAVPSAVRTPHEVTGQAVAAIATAPIVVDGDPVANPDIGHPRAKAIYNATRFVPRNSLVAPHFGRGAAIAVQVAAAQPAGFQPDDDFTRTRFRVGVFPHLGFPVA
jgi:hypothetical protein